MRCQLLECHLGFPKDVPSPLTPPLTRTKQNCFYYFVTCNDTHGAQFKEASNTCVCIHCKCYLQVSQLEVVPTDNLGLGMRTGLQLAVQQTQAAWAGSWICASCVAAWEVRWTQAAWVVRWTQAAWAVKRGEKAFGKHWSLAALPCLWDQNLES